MEFIRLAISQPFVKIETSGLDQSIFLKLCNQVHSGHVTGHKLFLIEKCQYP